MVGVDHQLNGRIRQGIDNCRHDGQVVVQPKAQLDLHRLEAGRLVLAGFFGQTLHFALSLQAVEPGGIGLHVCAMCPTQQGEHRLAEDLTGQIPERNINGADRRDHRTLASIIAGFDIHVLPQHRR